jgi:uncharacterized RDD family membrane protein YckC
MHRPGSTLLNGFRRKRLSFRFSGGNRATALRLESPIPRDYSLLLLRIAAFLVDALAAAVVLIPPASLASYGILWARHSMRPVSWIWWSALLLFLLFLLFRDALGGRSFGKRLMALEIRTASGARVGAFRSAARNVPLIVPGWNLLELVMLLFAANGRRSGDRITGTVVGEE